MKRRNALRPLLALAVALCGIQALAADAFPTKPIRIIIPAGAGGSLDLTTRLVAQKMSEKLGQQVIVDNRPGADTVLGTRMVKEAPADGYTLLAQAPGFSLLPYIKLDPGYEPLKDFVGLGNMVDLPFIMVAGTDQPYKTVQEFVALAKTKKLNYAHGGTGTPPQISAALFLQAAGINNITAVGYKGNGPALPDVAGGRVGMIFDGYISSKAYIEGGKLRVLAVTAPRRIAPLPNVPTFLESGVNYSYMTWLGLLVRAETPKDVVQKLSDALKFALTDKDLSERFRSEGSDPTFTTPEAFTERLRKEYLDTAKIAADLNMTKQ